MIIVGMVARRLMRNTGVRRSAIVMAAAAAAIITMYVTLEAFTLSSAQVVERDFGRYQYRADLSNVLELRPGDIGGSGELRRAIERAGAHDAMFTLSSFDVHPVVRDDKFRGYIEAEWQREPFPDRFVLLRGRWPTAPGEVVLTEPARHEIGPSSEAQVLSGNESFQVVGVAHDRYVGYPIFLAAEGTWSHLGTETVRRFPTLSAIAVLHWNGADPRRVAEAVGKVRSVSRVPDADVASDAIRATATARSQALAEEPRSYVSTIPIAYTVPSLVLPLLAVLGVFALTRRRSLATAQALSGVGLPRRSGALACGLATTAWLLVATASGCGVGVVGGVVVRFAIDNVRAEPISPFPDLLLPVVQLFSVTILACVFAIVALTRAAAAQAGEHPAPTSRPRSDVDSLPPSRHRDWLILLLFGTLVFQAASLTTVKDAMILAGTSGLAVVLLSPFVVRLALSALSDRTPRLRLARQQLLRNRSVAPVVALLAVVLGGSVAMTVLLVTLISSGEAQIVPGAPPGQAVLQGVGGAAQEPPDEVVREVERRVQLPAQSPVRLQYLWTERERASLTPGAIETLLAVDTVPDVQRLAGRSLTPEERQVLGGGGALVWYKRETEGKVRVSVESVSGRRTTESIRTVTAPFPATWKSGTEGVLLSSTARALGLPSAPGAVVYTGLLDRTVAEVQQAVVRAGFDSGHVAVYRPPSFLVPKVWVASAIGLGVMVLVATLAIARAQVATLRRYLGCLVAIGLSPRWVRQVLVLESATVVALSSVLGLAMAFPSMALAAWRIRGVNLDIPWTWLLLILSGFYLAALLGTIMSSRRLSAVDRQSV